MEGDQVDGAVGGAIESDSEQNKMALYKRVASKLAIMADEYIQSDSEGACSASEIPVPDTCKYLNFVYLQHPCLFNQR